jgi:methyl-accepting chemotaxis protein
VLVVIIVLMVIAVVGTGLFIFRHSFTSYREDLHRAIHLTKAAELARTAQMHFKTQMQEWKDILLRGSNSEDYQNYLKLFNQRRAQVAKDFDRLAQLLTEAGDEKDQEQVRLLLEELRAVDTGYQKALASFRPGDQTSPFEVDRQVRGLDREPTEHLGKIVDSISFKANQILEKADTSLHDLYELLQEILVIVSVLVLVLTLSLTFTKRRT